MHVSLAPMEGVIDSPMRRLLTDIGGYDRCVTEFVRVTDVLLPERVFFRICPELATGCRTMSGIPVFVQLLGGQPHALAVNAVRAADLGAAGIDLNFGCPAKTVNRSDGGSVLLRSPHRVADIVGRVRDAVDPALPVHAKIRLGYEHMDDFDEIAEGIAAAGANALCIHARTKQQGYKPPAHWQRVSAFSASAHKLTLTINGEIWAVDDAYRAQIESGCENLMLGRGALARPDLARQIKATMSGQSVRAMTWPEVLELVELQFARSDMRTPRYIGNRTKQWLAYLKRNYQGAVLLFERIKRLHDIAEISDAFKQHRINDLSGLEDPDTLENKSSLKNKSSSGKDDSIIVAGGVVNEAASVRVGVLHR